MNNKNRFNVEEHTTLDNKVIDVFPISHRYIHDLEQQYRKQKEVIDKTRRFLKDEGQKQYNIHDNYRGKWYSPDELDILNKILEDKEVSE